MPLSTRWAKRSRVLKEHKRRLIDMPLDVLIEIFLFLEPLDLLHLARTTKGLRGFLLNRRRASALWKNVIGNIKDLPPCPDHMSPPAYTHLAFVPVCHGCFCPCETIEWDLRMRCCPDCFPKMTIPLDSIRTISLNRTVLPVAIEHCKLHNGFNVVAVLDRVPFYCISRLDWKVFRSRKRPRNVSPNEFLAQQIDYWNSIQAHARLCRHWEYGMLEEKAAQLSRVREQRIKDIKDKLKELGWTDVVSSDSCDRHLLRLPEARILEPLTPTEWTQISPQLISRARDARKHQMWHRLMNTLTSISPGIQQELKSDTSLKVLPQGIDIATLPAVQSVLESSVKSHFNPDKDYDILKKKLVRVLPSAIRKWSSDAVKELEQFAREQLGLPPLSNPSTLLSVIFECKICSRSVKRRSRFTFDEALSHHHLYKVKRKENKGEHTCACEMSIPDKLLMRYGTTSRSIQVLRVDIIVSRRVENLIKRMGQNPNRVARDELHRSSVKVVCGLCRSEDANRMCFEDALDHCLNTHIRDEETEVWARASARK